MVQLNTNYDYDAEIDELRKAVREYEEMCRVKDCEIKRLHNVCRELEEEISELKAKITQ